MRRIPENAIFSVGVALILSLVLQPLLVFAADMPMTSSTPTTSPSGSTPPTEPQTAPRVITCPESSPACSFDKSITMTFTDKGIVFSSKPTEHGGPYDDPQIHITTLIQKSLEKNLQKYQEGIFSGYRQGFLDGKAGKDKESGKLVHTEPQSRGVEIGGLSRSYADGFSSGYDDGHAAGLFERSLGLTKK